MTQCKIKRNKTIDVVWIPEKFAQKDNYLEINGVNGWKVLEIWNTMDVEVVYSNIRDYTKTRIASDIPRGKIKGDLMKEINAKNNRNN